MPVLSPMRLSALAALAMSIAGLGTAAAQEVPQIDLRHGALLIHGNFCGPGNRGPNHPPIDALDAACARHDACTPPAGTLAQCSCNDRLSEEAELIANDPATPSKVRKTAQFIADGALALPCDD